MAERRSLGDAINLTPEKLAFIRGREENASSEPQRPSTKGSAKSNDKGLSPARVPVTEKPEVADVRPRRQRRRPEEYVAPSVDEVLNEVLVPLTTRLPHRLVQSLRHVCLEQKLKHTTPDSIQEIVEIALEDWLAKRTR